MGFVDTNHVVHYVHYVHYVPTLGPHLYDGGPLGERPTLGHEQAEEQFGRGLAHALGGEARVVTVLSLQLDLVEGRGREAARRLETEAARRLETGDWRLETETGDRPGQTSRAGSGL